jgi:hypothetical protein
MKTTLKTRIAALALVGSTAIGGVAIAQNASAAPAAPARAATVAGTNSNAQVTFMNECVKNKQVQAPKTFQISCADAGSQLTGLKWARWGANTATARGTLVEKTCVPDCATGGTRKMAVRVTVSNVKNREASRLYRKITVRVIGKKAAHTPRVQTITLPG